MRSKIPAQNINYTGINLSAKNKLYSHQNIADTWHENQLELLIEKGHSDSDIQSDYVHACNRPHARPHTAKTK